DVIGAHGQLPESGKLALFTLGYAAVCYGAARAVFDLLYDYLKRPDKKADAAIQKIMGEMAMKIQSVHLLLVDAALECAKGVGPANTQALAMTKASATETAKWMVDQAMALFGGRGYRDGTISRLYREIPGPFVMPPNLQRCHEAIGQLQLGFEDVALIALNDD
ncbi:MAG: hypothetical protein IIB15_07030, partial [Chloroflexi bacterium]|nr:hypothetical protein [Chloroflexota bacterium]